MNFITIAINNMAQPQVIDWRILLWEELTPNQKYSKIINYDIRKAPFENNGYQKKFVSSPRETTDKYNIFLTKREGLSKASLWEYVEWSNADYIEITSWYTITDDIFLDWVRYLMAVSNDYTHKKIFKQFFLNKNESCGNNEDSWVDEGRFVNISKYTNWQWTYNFFYHNKCIDPKFTVAFWPKWLSVASGTRGKIVNKVVGNEILTYFYDDNNALVGAEAWDFIYIYDWDFCTQLLGISWVESNVWWHAWVLMEWPFAGFNSVQVPTEQNIFDQSWNLLQKIQNATLTTETSNNHKRKLFKKRGDVIYFATSDGIFVMNDWWNIDDDGNLIHGEFTYEGNTYLDTLWWLINSRFTISSLINKDESLVFLDNNLWIVYHGLSGYQKAYFDPRNSYEAGKSYNELAVLSWYLIYIGREKIMLMHPKFVTASIVNFWWEIFIDKEIWCFNYWSWKSSWSMLFWVWSDLKYRKTVVETYGEFAIVPKTQIQFVAYQSDMDICRRDIDNVYVDWDWLREYIFLSWNNNTIVLVKDVFWMKRVYKWYELNGISKLAMRGNGIHQIKGYKDNGVDYPTVIQMTLGETDFHVQKQLYAVKLSIWYNSIITAHNTHYSIEFDCDWRNGKRVNWDLYRSSYVSNIMRLKDNIDDNIVFEEQPIGITLSSGNWQVNKIREKRTIDKEIDSIFDFSDWLKKTRDSNNISNFDIAKYWVIEIPYNIQGNTIHFAVYTRWSDKIETWGIWMLFEPMDAWSNRMWDVLTIWDVSLTFTKKTPLTKK